MRCKICGSSHCKKTSDVHHLMAYSLEEDEDGHFHYHDRNGRWQEWECEKGHKFNCVAFNHCWCGWSSQYPYTCKHKFKEKPPCKGYKFAKPECLITNEKWIVNLKSLGEK